MANYSNAHKVMWVLRPTALVAPFTYLNTAAVVKKAPTLVLEVGLFMSARKAICWKGPANPPRNSSTHVHYSCKKEITPCHLLSIPKLSRHLRNC